MKTDTTEMKSEKPQEAYESFMEKNFCDSVDRRRVLNGNGEYMAWDMALGWVIWQHCTATPQAEPQNSPSNISEIMPDRWISVSERMPEKGQSVLISVNFDSSLVEPLICTARYTGSTFRRGGATVKPGTAVEEATHWQPLPAPPQWSKV
ncbi:TPA: DUF551 domain-containing protein [Raoultella ornithinolytica]|nr:DUF551 domain-containing protein [Raoultella ornithinolytica]